jgi:hypothetical protein
MKQTFVDIKNWIVWSSINPNQISLTLKALVPLFILLGIREEMVKTISDQIPQIIVQAGIIITGFTSLYGLIRKIVISLVGKNDAMR